MDAWTRGHVDTWTRGHVDTWTRGQRDFEWVEPTGGGVGLVRFAPHLDVDTECFYETLLAEHGTYVGPGHWFELDDRHFPSRLRLADRDRVSGRARRGVGVG